VNDRAAWVVVELEGGIRLLLTKTRVQGLVLWYCPLRTG